MGNRTKYVIKVIGAGLAGSEAALVLSRIFAQDENCGDAAPVEIKLIEMRPVKATPVHKTDMPAELVCSNSFKSTKPNSAAGMLKYELEALHSPLYGCALKTKVDAGGALAVDREKFAAAVEREIEAVKYLTIERREVTSLQKEMQDADAVILATGPMTSDALADELAYLTGEDHLAFYDAAAPIVEADTIDTSIAFEQDRYGKKGNSPSDNKVLGNKCEEQLKDAQTQGDYLNCPMTKEEYECFINELLKADTVIKKDFESRDLFSACQPIEEVARSGFDAPRFGALKPVGIVDPRTGIRPYAVVQLRAENAEKTAYNLVGFQTNLKFGEQKRIFKMIPGLQSAEFSRYGVMHRNTFINAPTLLNEKLQFIGVATNNADIKENKAFTAKTKNLYIAGQLSGTEGYLEAVRSGHHAAICAAAKITGVTLPNLTNTTAFGALLGYATNPDTTNYQPMHVNFGIMPPLPDKIRNKHERYSRYAQRGMAAINDYALQLQDLGLL